MLRLSGHLLYGLPTVKRLPALTVATALALIACESAEHASPTAPPVQGSSWVYLPAFEDLSRVCAAIGSARSTASPPVQRPDYGGPLWCGTTPSEVTEPSQGGGPGVSNRFHYGARADGVGRVAEVRATVDVYNTSAEAVTLGVLSDSARALFDAVGLAVPPGLAGTVEAGEPGGFNMDYGVVLVHRQHYGMGYGLSVVVRPARQVAE